MSVFVISNTQIYYKIKAFIFFIGIGVKLDTFFPLNTFFLILELNFFFS